MIERHDFITKYIARIIRLLQEELPEKGTLQEMVDKAEDVVGATLKLEE